MKRKITTFTLLASLVSALVSLQAAEVSASGAGGIITGHVSNAATGNLLEGAKVEVPQLGRSVLTDNTGYFQIPDAPAGTYELVASYIGLDPVRSSVTIAAGQRATQEFSLTTGIYTLQEFKVTGEREGAAAAITAQRNAMNAKNIVAMDSFGNLPNLSASEVVIRLPGVASNLSGSGAGLADGFSVRGMGPGLNMVTVDGGLLSTQNSINRLSNINNMTGAMFEEIELVKGHTPDKGADSVGGTVNLKTRSAFRMKEKRRIIYSASVKVAPSFTQQIPQREARRSHPLFDVAYQEVFNVAGGERNLGVSISAFYSENVQGFFRTTRDFENTINPPAYVWDFRTADNYNNRMHSSTNMKLDYRLSPNTTISLTTMINDTNENRRTNYETRFFTGQSVGTTGTAGILPGYTDRFTQVRAMPNSIIDMSAPGQGWALRLRSVDLAAEQNFGRLHLDYDVRWNHTDNAQGTGKTGSLTMRLANVGWTLDRTKSDLFPRLVQTEGPDFLNGNNYRPTTNGLSTSNNFRYFQVKEARANARYEIPATVPLSFKTGVQWREQEANNRNDVHRWNYTGTGPLPANAGLVTLDSRKTGRMMPQWTAGDFMDSEGIQPLTPALWNEDKYFHEADQYTGKAGATETVVAGYVMAQGKLGRGGLLEQTNYIAGVRSEKTTVKSYGWVRARVPSTTAQQVADPLGAAQRDYANTRRTLSGSYTKSFPSVHLTHEISRNLKALLSWSTSFGRPGMGNFLPNETISENNQTLTLSNPALLPQRAVNWDASLEYYFEPVGTFTVGWFNKQIKDFIVTGINAGTIATGADNGFNGEYSGFTRLSTANAGTAYVQGWEITYQQQFTFLPGFLKGLSLSANYTLLDTRGDFGGKTNLSTGQVAGFTPSAGNVNLSWRYHGFSVRVLSNYNGTGITSYSAVSPGLNLYRDKRTTVSAGLAYQIRPTLSVTLDAENLSNAAQVNYRAIHDRMQRYVLTGTTITGGISGRF